MGAFGMDSFFPGENPGHPNRGFLGDTATSKIDIPLTTEPSTFNFVPKLRAGDGMNSSRIQRNQLCS